MATPTLVNPAIVNDATVASDGVEFASASFDSTGCTKACIAITGYNSTPPTLVRDSKGNVWTQDGSGFAISADPEYLFYYKSDLDPAKVGTGHIVYVTPSWNFGVTFQAIFAKPSAGGTLSMTAWNGATDDTSPHTSASVDPNPDEAKLLAFGAHDQNSATQTYNWTGSSFTELTSCKDFTSFFPLVCAYRNFNAAGSVAASFTSTSATHGGIGMIAITESAASGAVLAATAADVASATGALTTQIKAAAAAADVAAASGALTTAIRLASAAVAQAAATGALTTQIRPAASATDVAAASGALTTQIPLQGAAADVAAASASLGSGPAALAAAASDVAVAVAALTTGIQLNGAAVDTAVASGALTNWATVTLSGTLYTGQGGALDPNFWTAAVPTVGTTLYYDGTHIAIATNAEVSSDTNNCTAVVQFFNGTDWEVGLIVITPQLVANALGSSLATAQLTSAINLAAAAQALATVTAALTTQIPLAAQAQAVANASGALTTLIRLQAAASAQSSASASLGGALMNANAAVVTSASASLTTASLLAANAADVAAAQGSLTTQVRMQGAAADVATAIGDLTTSIWLAAQAQALSSAAADLQIAKPLTAAAIDVATASALLSTGVLFTANASGVVTANASLRTGAALSAAAQAVSAASASLTNEVALFADAISTALSSGTLTSSRIRQVGPTNVRVLVHNVTGIINLSV